MTAFAQTLDKRVTLQQPATGEDAAGQPSTSWSDVATLWANIRLQSGLETIKAGAEKSIVRASVRIRYRTGITAGMRILHGTTAYNIEAVLPDPGKRHVDLVCEVVA